MVVAKGSRKNLKVHPKNSLNNLDGDRWLYFTRSYQGSNGNSKHPPTQTFKNTVWETAYPSILGHDLRKKQGGNKPPQLMQEIIEYFTKKCEKVLDPFFGAGGTALGAYLSYRECVGIEINPESVEIYKKVCKKEGIEPCKVYVGDCLKVLDNFEGDSFDLIATDPPYGINLEQTMSGVKANEKYKRQNRKTIYKKYSNIKGDLSLLPGFDSFFDAMEKVGEKMFRVLKPKKYLVVILRDAYQNGEYIPTTYHVAERLKRAGFIFKGIKIWYAAGARMRPYGYPYAYVPNIVHQNLLIMQKPEYGKR